MKLLFHILLGCMYIAMGMYVFMFLRHSYKNWAEIFAVLVILYGIWRIVRIIVKAKGYSVGSNAE